MYPDSFSAWVIGTAVIMGCLAVICLTALWLDHRYQKHIEKHHGAPRNDEEGRSSVWTVFEVLSAIFVVTGLLVAIYSDSQVLRGIAGIAMIVLVAAATTSALDRGGRR